MWNIKKITILLCFLSLVAFISCSAEDKTGGDTGGETGDEIETTEETTDFPHYGIYRDDNIWKGWNKYDFDTKVSTASGKTTIIGYSMNKKTKSAQKFGFDISKWKKETTKSGKITFKAVEPVVETGYNFTDISIVYYYDTKTLKITFKIGADCSFEGKLSRYNM